MRVAFITRPSLFSAVGGDTLQVLNTAKYLEKSGVPVDIRLTSDKISYRDYDLLHFFSIIRPAGILPHMKRSKKPFVVTPLLIDYSEFDCKHRKGIAGKILRFCTADQLEYMKAVARWATRRQPLGSYAYLAKGQRNSVRSVAKKAALLLPNSLLEYRQFARSYAMQPPYDVIPNGIEPDLFKYEAHVEKDTHMVICVARIEGLKNQLHLIKALNHSPFQLFIIGDPAVNQHGYYRECRSTAAANVHFVGHLPQQLLLHYYQRAKVHILPSWFETCGLSSLEAGAMGCNVVITNKGYASEYFGSHAFYCDPSSPASIREAVTLAANANACTQLREAIGSRYTWEKAAIKTLEAYKKIISV